VPGSYVRRVRNGVTGLGDRRREWCVHHFQQWCAQAFGRVVVF
jgi:hypothetical protein